MTALQMALQAARAAIAGRASAPVPGLARPVLSAEVVLDPTRGTGSLLNGCHRGQPTCQPSEVPVPRISFPASPSQMPEPCAPLVDLVAGVPLSRGAARLFGLLHEVAHAVARARAYSVLPDAVTFHAPQTLLAAAAGYTDRHVRRLLPELVAAGLLDWGAHASRVNGVSLWDGCLWAVRVRPGDALPRISRVEWQHQWRDFAGDLGTGHTAQALMSGLHAQEGNSDVLKGTLKAWAVNPGVSQSPVGCTPDMPGEGAAGRVPDLREVVYRLGDLLHVHPTKRAERVGRLASALGRALNDAHSRRFYCGLLWQAWRGETEGRGTLQTLMSALLRLEADRQEWKDLRSPGALLVARLRAA